MNAHATLVPVPGPPGQVQGELLREDENEWVLRTTYGREMDDALTRVCRKPVGAAAGARLRGAVLEGGGLDEQLPWELRRILEGYRVRASLPAGLPLPAVLDCGVTNEGLAYVTRAWVDGVPLSKGWTALVPELKDEVLAQVLDLLEVLHGAGVVVQDLKPDNTVLDAQARLWLVDLESLRATPSGAIPCTHYTPRFAAPEQLRGRVSMAASDLFAFGRMVSELSAASAAPVPARWVPMVAACLAEDPRLRPTAAMAARGGMLLPDATIRVPEPTDTDSGMFSLSFPPVPTATVEVEPTTATELVVPPRRSGWIRALALFSAVGMVLFGVAVALTMRQQLEDQRRARIAADRAADELTDQVREALREHKVVAAKNNDQELGRILVMARQGTVLRRDPDTLGLLALATVWSQRWHWRGAHWDPDLFAIADRMSHEALSAGETPEAVLARGLTAAAGCRHAPKDQPVEAWCDEAMTELDRAATLGPDWMKVEAVWGAVMVLDTRAKRAFDAGDPAAVELAREALNRCEAAKAALPAAKVNGPELVEDCAWSAAVARDRTAWFAWTGWQLRNLTDGVHVPPARMGDIVRSAAPECARLQVDAVGMPTETGPWPDWCAGMAVRTLRCAGMSLNPEDPARSRKPAWCPPQ